MSDDWLSRQMQRIENLKFQKVRGFVATEMAFKGGDGDGKPLFEDASLPFLQVCPLYVYFEDNRVSKFITYQDDTTFGICLSDEVSPTEGNLDPGSNNSIYRTRKLRDFPAGLVTEVKIKTDDEGNICEIELFFGEDAILLVAGEVQEVQNGTWEVLLGDESILLFRNPKWKNAVNFR